MATGVPIYLRLEPRAQERNLAGGFAAAVHDPVWFLARQWQMGEHQGENASTPVLVELDAIHTPIEPSTLALDLDPTALGPALLLTPPPPSFDELGGRLPPPYERLAGRIDGLALWRHRADLGI